MAKAYFPPVTSPPLNVEKDHQLPPVIETLAPNREHAAPPSLTSPQQFPTSVEKETRSDQMVGLTVERVVFNLT